MKTSTRPRLAILTNILTPYRVPIYRRLAERYETRVVISGNEDNRKWDTGALGQELDVRTAWGFMIKRRIPHEDGGTADLRYTHLNPGYLWHLLRFRPDAIISVEMGFRSLLALLYGAVFRTPVWIWWGGTLHTESKRAFAKRQLRRLFAAATPRWVSYGETSTQYLRSIGIPRRRILQIQNCVDERLYLRDGDAYPLDLPRPRALFVGQLIGRKGIYELLETTAAVQREGLECSLVVVGDGPEQGRFREEVERLEVQNLRHIKYLPPERMPDIYRACDFLVFPTLEDVWGLVVNEALLSGLPVIASTYAGCACELLPASNVFDPLVGASFLDAYRRAILGRIAPPDPSRIRTAREVADMIGQDVARRLRLAPE